MSVDIDIDQKTGMPNWKAMGRPRRAPRGEEPADPNKDIITDLVCSEEWAIYVNSVIDQAKPVHKALISGTIAQSDGVAALKAMLVPLEKIYARSSVPMPTFLRILLTGDFDGE